MHPAYSVIFFTTASGAGYGMLFLLCLGRATGVLSGNQWFGAVAFVLAFALATFGLLASTFHLGHPERAWRALSQWRTSWLSREGIVSTATFVPTSLFAIGWVFLGTSDGMWAWLSVVGALLAALTVYCTGMIYASLVAIPRWNDPLVVPVYLLFALASGSVPIACIAAFFGAGPAWLGWFAAGSLVPAWAAKLTYWRRIDNAPPRHTAGSATGLGGAGQVRLFEGPHTSENYLQREMGYRVARKHAHRLRVVALILGGAIPVLLSLTTAIMFEYPLWFFEGPGFPLQTLWTGAALLFLATLSLVCGLLIERWLFFAEARHVVTLYYGADAA